MCYGFSVLAWWFMAWHTHKNWNENHSTIRCPTLAVIIFNGLTAFCLVFGVCTHWTYKFVSLLVYRVTLYPIGIHMRSSQWHSRFMIEYLTTFQSYRDFDGMCPCVYRNGARLSNVNIVWEIPICFAFPPARPPPHTSSDLKIWLKYIENYW